MISTNRREILIGRMDELKSSGIDCLGCSGRCCTFEANSMMLTPLEAIELISYLKTNNLLTPELLKKLQETRSSYRLEPKYQNTRSYLRKTYTCPFFNNGELGCPLPREVKPYGCLAFNAHHQTNKASSECFSELDILEKRDDLHLKNEDEINEELRKKYNLFWEKAPIPNALLELWEKFNFAHPPKD
jgi:hypothetical protein